MQQWISKLFILAFGLVLFSACWAEEADRLPALSPNVAHQLYNPQMNAAAGNPKGTVTLVEFFDYNCHYCRKLMPTLERLAANNPNLRIVYKEYPLFGERSEGATAVALAAQKQGKYLMIHKALLRTNGELTQAKALAIAEQNGLDMQQLKKDMHSAEVRNQVDKTTDLAHELNVDIAPFFIIASTNGKTAYIVRGSNNAERNLQHLIDQVKGNH